MKGRRHGFGWFALPILGLLSVEPVGRSRTSGAPAYDVGNGSFESPQFVHLTGPWYSFASSW